MAISGDGDTVVVGSPGNFGLTGQVEVYKLGCKGKQAATELFSMKK